MPEVIIGIIKVVSRVDLISTLIAGVTFTISSFVGEYFYKRYLVIKFKEKSAICIKGHFYRLIEESEAVENDIRNLSIKTKRDSE